MPEDNNNDGMGCGQKMGCLLMVIGLILVFAVPATFGVSAVFGIPIGYLGCNLMQNGLRQTEGSQGCWQSIFGCGCTIPIFVAVMGLVIFLTQCFACH